MTWLSATISLVNRDVILVRIRNHRHATDRSRQDLDDKRHGLLLEPLHKGVQIRGLNRDHRALGPWRMPHVPDGDGG